MKLGKIKKKWIYLNQSELFIQITNLKKALKVHRKIKFNQQDWLRPYIEMNTGLRKKPKNSFEKVFFKLMIKAVFGKAMADMRKNRAIKLVTTESKINFLVREPNYHATKFFIKNLLATEMKKLKY